MQSYQLGQRFTTTGVPLNGGKAYFYLTTTTTLENVFDDPALGGGNAYSNPVVADSSGFFPELVYLDPTKTYRCVIKTSAGVTISDADPINTPQSGGGIDGADIDDDTIPATAFAPGAIPDALGYTPANETDLNVVQAVTTALTGMVAPFITTSAPTGWVKANGETIGDGSSGGTSRANADTANLFALIWALDATNFPITDSVGGASTRGASAAADFAAHKRLPVPDLRAEFIRGLDDSRGVDTSRVLGSSQAGQMPSHTHTLTAGSGSSGPPNQASVDTNATDKQRTTDATGGTDNSSENRPRNISLLFCIKL